MASETQKIFGVKACLALWNRRPHGIQRIYYRRDRAVLIGDLLRWAASQRIPYREQEEEGLRKVAGNAHHEGLVLAADPLRYLSFDEGRVEGASRWVALDRVENPHNLGAIMRTCAFFGLDGVIAGGLEPGTKVNGAALRVAEGGAEHLTLCAAPDPASLLQRMAGEGFKVIGLESGGETPIQSAPAEPPWVLVAGHEAEGLTPETRRVCGAIHAIEGEGQMESLNVSVAVGVALGELLRKPPNTPPHIKTP